MLPAAPRPLHRDLAVATLRRRRLLGAAAGFGAALAWPAVRACEIQAEHFRLIHPWTRATAPDERTAVLCMSFEDVTRDDALVGVETPVARGAEAAGLPAAAPDERLELPIPAGRQTVLAENGPHVRLTGLAFALQVGRDYPLVLHFRESGAVLARLSVDLDPQVRFAAPVFRFR
jgi:copper(I)-binding protein